MGNIYANYWISNYYQRHPASEAAVQAIGASLLLHWYDQQHVNSFDENLIKAKPVKSFKILLYIKWDEAYAEVGTW